MTRWTVHKRDGRWRVIDNTGSWYATYDTLHEAHTEATQGAIACHLYAPGGLTRLRRLLAVEGWLDWAARH